MRQLRGFVQRFIQIRLNQYPSEVQSKGHQDSVLLDLASAAQQVATRPGKDNFSFESLSGSVGKETVSKLQNHLQQVSSKGKRLSEGEYKAVVTYATKYLTRNQSEESVAYFKDVVEPDLKLL